MKRLKELREEKGLTIRRLAVLSGVFPSVVKNFETKENRVLANIERLADFLGVSPAYLCGWSDHKTEQVRVIEKVVQVPVVERVYHQSARIPEEWRVEDNRIIRWTRRGRPV